MGDLLGAASLFLAVLGLLYGAWYGEVVAAQAVGIATHRADREPAIRQVRAAYRTRSLPLALGSVVLVVILAPSFVDAIARATHACADSGLGAVRSYDAVATLFCAVYVAAVMLGIHLIRMSVRLHGRLARLMDS